MKVSDDRVDCLTAITDVLLGLPVPGYFIEYISKLMTENEANTIRLFSAGGNEEAKEEKVKKTIIGTILEQFKSLQDSGFEILNADPNFKLVDTHTKFFHFLLTTQAKGSEPADAAKIILPQVIFQNLSKIKYTQVSIKQASLLNRDL
mgnify:FL=1